jgi:hypothetical protein
MRTTVDIPDPTYRKLKSKAAQQGRSVKDLILQGVEKELGAGSRKRGKPQVPLVRSKQPGRLRLTNEQIYEIIPFP